MSFFSYLDEEYFQLQDFLSTLIDTLPILNMHSLPDDKTLVQTLIDQNKFYAKKVVSLYQKINTLYANTSQSLEKSERVSTNAFVDRLKEKLHEYEDEIQRLKSENDAFSNQLKHLSQLSDPLQAKNSLPGTFFTLGGQNQGNLQQTGIELSPNEAKKSVNNSFNIPSPIPRSSRISKDASFDLEQLFQTEDYKKAMDLLIQLDYELPQNVPVEKFNKWLAISNRIKDSQFNDILRKLKNVTSSNVESKLYGERGSLEKGFEDLLDQQKLRVVEKISWILDEIAVNNSSGHHEKKNPKPRLEKRRNFETEESQYQTAEFRDPERTREGHLLGEIAYLKENLQASETILREREAEVRMLSEKMRNIEEGELTRRSEGVSDAQTKGRVRVNGEAKEVKVERDMFKRKYEENNRELEEYRERYNNAREEAEEYRIRYADFERKIMAISDGADKLKEENERLKRGIQIGSKQELTESNEEDIENYYRVQKPKPLGKEIEVTDFMSERAHQRTPTVAQLSSPETAPTLRTNDLKGNLLIENSLQVQRNNLYNVKQSITEFKSYIFEKLKSLDIEPQTLPSPQLAPEDRSEPTTEAQRSLKTNTHIIKGINNEIKDLKRDTINIINKLSWTKPVQSPKQKKPESDSNLRERISHAEEKLMENLSQTLQSLSKLTASLHDMGDNGLEGPLAENMAQVFNDLQGIHSRIEKTIQEFPEFSTHEIKPELKMLKRGQLNETQYDNTHTLRKKLATDRNDLTTQLRMTLQKFESSMANDALERLSEEMSKNQDLQDVIEAKNILIHKLNMLFSEGLETCEVSIRHLFELADSDDSQRIVESILDNFRTFRRTFTDANAQYRSPKKRVRMERIEEEDFRLDSGQRKSRLNKSGLKSSLKEARTSPDRSPGVSKKGSFPSIRWGDGKDERGTNIQFEETGWLASEKQRILEEMTNRCDELRQKVKNLERENFELAKELDILKESNERVEIRNRELKDMLEKKHEECRNVAREASRDMEARGREIEELRRRVNQMDRENQELRDYRQTAEGMLKRASDQVGQLKLGYFSEVNGLKEANERLETEREEVVGELQRKIDENAKLNQLIETLQKFSNKQLEGLRDKEEKVTLLANQKRESEVMARELERQMELLSQKNKISLERAKESMDDVTSVKYELSRALEKQEILQKELEMLTVKNRELVQDRDNLLRQKDVLESERSVIEDKMKKMSEIVEITKSELRKAHELLEQRSEEIKKKDKEIQRLREVSLQKDDHKEPDYVTYLKRELQARNEELQRIKAEYRKTLDVNERLGFEMNNVKATNRLGASSNRPSVTGDRGASQQSTRKDIYRSGEKDLKEELGMKTSLTTKKSESSSNLNYEQRTRGFEGSHTERIENLTSGQKLFTLGDSGANAQPSAGVAHQKDREIQRLNQVVKDLTNSLQSSQNSANAQIRRHIQFSSPQ